MHFSPSTLLLTTLLPILTLSTPTPHTDSSIDWNHLSTLLDTIDDNVLHGVLHQLSPKFQDGVFSKDRSALEHVHSEDPVIATKLVHIAIKRQNSNGTTTAAAPTTTAPNQASAISSQLSEELTASTVPPPTTVIVPPSAPADATAVATVDGGIVYSTYGGGLVTLTSSAVGVHFTPSTSTLLFYSTAPNGVVSTSTEVVVVNAPVTGSTETAAQGAAATSGSNPSLQDSATAVEVSGVLAAVMLGVAGIVCVL